MGVTFAEALKQRCGHWLAPAQAPTGVSSGPQRGALAADQGRSDRLEHNIKLRHISQNLLPSKQTFSDMLKTIIP